MNNEIDFHSGRLKRAYEHDKKFYNLLSGLSLATLIAVISLGNDASKNEIKDVSVQTRGFVSVTLNSDSDALEQEMSSQEELDEEVLDEQENQDLISENESMDEENEDKLKSFSVNEFQEKFKIHFEPFRQKLIAKYSKFFSSEKLGFEVYKDFVLEFSYAQSVAIKKAQRNLGWVSQSDDEIEESVRDLKEKFLESFELKLKRVLSSKDKLQELENILNETNYIGLQPSLFDMYDSKVNGGNCVVRALETTLLLEALQERLGSSGDFDDIGLLLMPKHIVATASDQSSGKTTLIDASNSVLETDEIGTFYTGGQKLQVLLAETEIQKQQNRLQNSENTGFIEGSPYFGVSPGGESSNVDSKEYLKRQLGANQRKFNQQLSKFFESISQDEKETLELTLSFISNIEIKKEYLRILESGGDSSEFLKSKQRQILQANGLGFEITLNDLKNKQDSFKDFFELYELSPISDLIRIKVDSVSENQELNQFANFYRFEINPSPSTLVGIKADTVDISRLQDLSEILRQNEIEKASNQQEELDVDESQLDLTSVSLDNLNVDQNDLDDEESRRIPELEIARVSRYQFKKLALMDLSKVKTVFEFSGGVSFIDFKNLDGFNGIISLQNFQKFDYNLLETVDLSNATFALSYLNSNELRVLLSVNIGRFLIRDISVIEDIVENDLFTINPNANFVIDDYLKEDPEFKILSCQSKYKAFLRNFTI